MNKLISMFLGEKRAAIFKYKKLVKLVEAHRSRMVTCTDNQLKEIGEGLRNRVNANNVTGDMASEDMVLSFALVREVSRRVLKMEPYHVQLMGGFVLEGGDIAEMKTGEGKTLVAVMPAYYRSLSGKGVHIITVNDYLAKRDMEWMSEIYHFLGVSVSCIQSEMDDQQRKEAYECDVTYGTNNEFAFDYLRDNMKLSMAERVQRSLEYVIIDEVDDILINQARTPLIISAQSPDQQDTYQDLLNVISKLEPGDLVIEQDKRTAVLSEEGEEKITHLLKDMLDEGLPLYDPVHAPILHKLNQLIRAFHVYKKDQDYLVMNGKVLIVDNFTGRMMEGRRYSDGLHQALEAKENVEIQKESRSIAQITFQNYFRAYKRLAGMTGTAATEAREFKETYGIEVYEIPTHMSVVRNDLEDKVFMDESGKIDAVVEEVQQVHEKGQPVLLGTVSVDKSEQLSARLKEAGIVHSVLNARYHEQEAKIVAQAGRYKAVTISTNMAGRGTDIKLGGNRQFLIQQRMSEGHDNASIDRIELEVDQQIEREKERVIDAGGLYVIGTERNETRRADNQLRGRSGRQGDPGKSKFYVSLEDDLIKLFAPQKILQFIKSGGDGEQLEHPWITKAIYKAQQKIEARNYDMRRTLLQYDNVNDQQRKIFYSRRDEIMLAELEKLTMIVQGMLRDVSAELIDKYLPASSYPEEWDLEGLSAYVQEQFGVSSMSLDTSRKRTDVRDELLVAMERQCAEKVSSICSTQTFLDIQRSVLLQVMDGHWQSLLDTLHYIRSSVVWRSFAQKNPLEEYKEESLHAFERMLYNIRHMVVKVLLNVVFQAPVEGGKKKLSSKIRGKIMVPTNRLPSRNTICPCGSGRRFKYCHGKIDR